jgi:hypothetical protein
MLCRGSLASISSTLWIHLSTLNGQLCFYAKHLAELGLAKLNFGGSSICAGRAKMAFITSGRGITFGDMHRKVIQMSPNPEKRLFSIPQRHATSGYVQKANWLNIFRSAMLPSSEILLNGKSHYCGESQGRNSVAWLFRQVAFLRRRDGFMKTQGTESPRSSDEGSLHFRVTAVRAGTDSLISWGYRVTVAFSQALITTTRQSGGGVFRKKETVFHVPVSNLRIGIQRFDLAAICINKPYGTHQGPVMPGLQVRVFRVAVAMRSSCNVYNFLMRASCRYLPLPRIRAGDIFMTRTAFVCRMCMVGAAPRYVLRVDLGRTASSLQNSIPRFSHHSTMLLWCVENSEKTQQGC